MTVHEHECGPDTCGFASFEDRMAIRDEFDAIPWFTDQHAREAAQRMKAWASGAGHVPQLAASVLSDAEWLNLARVCLELKPRD